MSSSEREKRVFDFIDKIRVLEGDYEAVCDAVCNELAWYGLDYVTCADVPGPGRAPEDAVLLNTRPLPYVERYIEKNHTLRDPVVTELRHTVDPYTWADVLKRRRFSRRELDIVEEGRLFGFNDGLIIPIISGSGSLSIFSPCGLNPDLSPESRRAIELIGMYAQQAIRRALANKMRADTEEHVPLTPREREIMQFVATGKTDSEIADILSIGTATVTTHVESAKRKLGAYRRTYAIVLALRAGEISL